MTLICSGAAPCRPLSTADPVWLVFTVQSSLDIAPRQSPQPFQGIEAAAQGAYHHVR